MIFNGFYGGLKNTNKKGDSVETHPRKPCLSMKNQNCFTRVIILPRPLHPYPLVAQDENRDATASKNAMYIRMYAPGIFFI